jgi:hypothetical protein
MIQKDFIMRMIEQMGKMIAKALLNKEEGNTEEAIKEIDNSFSNLVGVDFRLFETLTSDNIAELLGILKDKSTGSMKCIIAAKLLKEKAELLKNNQTDESQKYLHKALVLYLKGILNIGYTEVDMESYCNDVRMIEKAFKGKISIEEMILLFEFFKKNKEFDKAENYLFHLRNANYPEINKIGIEFFKELEQVDEIDLRKSGLTKIEINETIKDFKRC